MNVPANAAELTLDFWCRVSGTDPDLDDNLCYEVIDSTFSEVLAGSCFSLYEIDPQNEWINFQLVPSGAELAPMLGETVWVSFNALNTPQSDPARVGTVQPTVSGLPLTVIPIPAIM